jgi:hypothetical protein
MRKRVFIIPLMLLGFIMLNCREISPGMTTDELFLSLRWGKPKEAMKIRDTKYEIWWYVSGYIDNILFIKDGKVIDSKKYSLSENIWETVRQWVLYVEREPVYRRGLDDHIDDIINQRLRIGMQTFEVRLSWGSPKEIISNLSKYGGQELWLYQRIPFQTNRLMFTNSVLTEISTE